MRMGCWRWARPTRHQGKTNVSPGCTPSWRRRTGRSQADAPAGAENARGGEDHPDQAQTRRWGSRASRADASADAAIVTSTSLQSSYGPRAPRAPDRPPTRHTTTRACVSQPSKFRKKPRSRGNELLTPQQHWVLGAASARVQRYPRRVGWRARRSVARELGDVAEEVVDARRGLRRGLDEVQLFSSACRGLLGGDLPPSAMSLLFPRAPSSQRCPAAAARAPTSWRARTPAT